MTGLEVFEVNFRGRVALAPTWPEVPIYMSATLLSINNREGGGARGLRRRGSLWSSDLTIAGNNLPVTEWRRLFHKALDERIAVLRRARLVGFGQRVYEFGQR